MGTHERITGVIVAGGRSTRFGSDKASAVVSGRSLLEWVVRGVAGAVEEVVVVRARGQSLPQFSAPVPLRDVEDVYEGKGPLAGLVAAFGLVGTPLAFAASCDVPLVQAGLVEGLAGLAGEHDIVIPHVAGYPQPLLAIYRPVTCLPAFRRAVEEDRLKITSAFPGLRVRVVREGEVEGFDADLGSFRNINRAEDLGALEAVLRDRE